MKSKVGGVYTDKCGCTVTIAHKSKTRKIFLFAGIVDWSTSKSSKDAEEDLKWYKEDGKSALCGASDLYNLTEIPKKKKYKKIDLVTSKKVQKDLKTLINLGKTK